MTCNGVPAAAVSVAAAMSTSSTPLMRSSDSTTQPAVGTAAPVSPVKPPCGTTGTFSAWQAASTAATSAVRHGRTTAQVVPAGAVTIESCR